MNGDMGRGPRRGAYGGCKNEANLCERRWGIAGEHVTGAEMAGEFSKVLGTGVYNAVTFDVYLRCISGFGFPGADDSGKRFQFKHNFNEECCGVRSVAESRELNPRLQTFEQWLSRQPADRLLSEEMRSQLAGNILR
jgi:hypothetical protein